MSFGLEVFVTSATRQSPTSFTAEIVISNQTIPARFSRPSTTESPAKVKPVPMGLVYVWSALDPANVPVGNLEKKPVKLLRLDHPQRLSGRFVAVHNDSVTKLPGTENANGLTAEQQPGVRLGDATPDAEGNFLFEPHHGGGRMERHAFAEPEMWERYIDASRFGEVNAYYHTDAVAAYVDQLLQQLGHPSLPQVIVRVNAHNAIGKHAGCCNGVLGKKSKKWYPLQGGHYRLPTKQKLTVAEHFPLSTDGEIHLGPGWRLVTHGALVDLSGGKYRSNASHNVGTIYHEYGHHLTRHTADFRLNELQAPHRQDNFKTDVDEAFCDYLAATMMGSPHIWACHHRHDSEKVHRRSLVSAKTMDDYDHSDSADAHDNGTILAATLWDLRSALIADAGNNPGAADTAIGHTDLLVVQSLILIGQLLDHPTRPDSRTSRRLRKGFGTVRQALLEADQRLFSGAYKKTIRRCFKQRGIKSRKRELLAQLWSRDASQVLQLPLTEPAIEKLKRKDRRGIIPPSSELLSSSQLDAVLRDNQVGPYAVVAVGDVMVGSRARHRTDLFGPDYVFQCVAPLFRRSSIVLANQEGPIARDAIKLPRNHSYKVNPKYTRVLRRAGFNVVTLANNHLLDCGREGVIETLKSLKKHHIHAIGAGRDVNSAHQPAIIRAGQHTVGLLGYYWNGRTSAKKNKPGSAMDTPEHLAADIGRLRPLVDRLVVTVHWGVPYEREPSAADREKARLMVSLGADIVIGHHPHIMQGIELVNDRPILYSVGNFAFGTGNSKAESLVVGVDFRTDATLIDFFPAYVKNRDPRVNYQPKIMTGAAAGETLKRLRSLSPDSEAIEVQNGIGRLHCNR